MSDVLMGYKGQSIMDAGYFFAPYIPITTTPVIDPNSFSPQKGILTRYGKKLLKQGAAHYDKLKVDTEDTGWGIKKKKKVQWNSIDEPLVPTKENYEQSLCRNPS
jgi:hypothetical protein